MTTLSETTSAAARAYIGRKHGMYIGSQIVDSLSGETSPIFDPGRGQIIAEIPRGNAADVDRAVAAAREAFETGPWRRIKPNERAKLIWKLADLLEENTELAAEIECLNAGMPFAAAKAGAVGSSVDLLRYTSGWPTKLTGETIPVSSPGEWFAYTMREPIGVVGQIVPWNGPLMMAIWKVAPALAAGCTIVLKPAEQTPLTAVLLGELCEKAGIPAGVVNVVTGGSEVGAAMASHPGIDKIAFTGSTQVGRSIVTAAAASNLKRVSLELGGKSPVIIFPDADLEVAIPGAGVGIFSNAGQICTSGSRLYAHRRVYDEVVEGVAKYAEGLKVGYSLDPSSQMGPLISSSHLARVAGMTERGVKEGASVVTGGEQLNSEGYFYKPTVLACTSSELSVAKEEIFGPVLSVMRYDDDDLDQIAREANNSVYGLAASIWTRDFSRAHKMAQRVRAGTIGINRHFVGDSALPFGGYRQSGWGRERGREVFDSYMEVKAIASPL
ncbi:aldehyde dehydrogenase family protein [Microvirga sp. 0TCS3.31]